MTNKEKCVFDAIKKYIKEYGYSPSYQDLADLTGINSKAVISDLLDRLKIKKYITFKSGKARTIQLVNDNWNELKTWLMNYYDLLLTNPDSYEETMLELLLEIIDKMNELEHGDVK